MAMRTSNGLEYSQTYLHSICNQLSAMLNHAVRYSELLTVWGCGSRVSAQLESAHMS